MPKNNEELYKSEKILWIVSIIGLLYSSIILIFKI